MAGTKAGGEKAAAPNKLRYGTSFYTTIGRKGGKISTGGGFTSESARIAGAKGGRAPRVTKGKE